MRYDCRVVENAEYLHGITTKRWHTIWLNLRSLLRPSCRGFLRYLLSGQKLIKRREVHKLTTGWSGLHPKNIMSRKRDRYLCFPWSASFLLYRQKTAPKENQLPDNWLSSTQRRRDTQFLTDLTKNWRRYFRKLITSTQHNQQNWTKLTNQSEDKKPKLTKPHGDEVCP